MPLVTRIARRLATTSNGESGQLPETECAVHRRSTRVHLYPARLLLAVELSVKMKPFSVLISGGDPNIEVQPDAWHGAADILHQVSCQRGEVVALMGRNGAGKSTTLKSIAALVPHREGSIRFMGEAIEKKPRTLSRSAAWAMCPMIAASSPS